MDSIIDIIANWLGVDPSVLIALIPTLVFLFNLAARAIPDDATGFMGVLRKIVKVLGLYLSNRVASGTTVNTTARIVALEKGLVAPPVNDSLAESAMENPTPAPSQQERDGRGRFVSKGNTG